MFVAEQLPKRHFHWHLTCFGRRVEVHYAIHLNVTQAAAESFSRYPYNELT